MYEAFRALAGPGYPAWEGLTEQERADERDLLHFAFAYAPTLEGMDEEAGAEYLWMLLLAHENNRRLDVDDLTVRLHLLAARDAAVTAWQAAAPVQA